MNMTVTNGDLGSVIIADQVMRDNTFVAGGAITYAAGTVLGRVTASGKLAPYASGAADGTEIPVAVLTEELVAAGAGDIAIRALVRGQVREEKLIEHGVGAITAVAVFDQLRDFGIVPVSVRELGIQDNQ